MVFGFLLGKKRATKVVPTSNETASTVAVSQSKRAMDAVQESSAKARKMCTVQVTAVSSKTLPSITRSFGSALGAGKRRAILAEMNSLQLAEQACMQYAHQLLLRTDKPWERFVQDKCTFDIRNLSERELRRQNAAYQLYTLEKNYNRQLANGGLLQAFDGDSYCPKKMHQSIQQLSAEICSRLDQKRK